MGIRDDDTGMFNIPVTYLIQSECYRNFSPGKILIMLFFLGQFRLESQRDVCQTAQPRGKRVID